MKNQGNGLCVGLLAMLAVFATSCAGESTETGETNARVLVYSGMCGAAGDACSSDSACCSEDCEDGVCLFYCKPHGDECTMNDQCCSRTCEDGVCVAPCTVRNHHCEENAECCSNRCVDNLCVRDPLE